MRRILVDQARKKTAAKRGGGGQRFELAEGNRVADDPQSADVARLRLFAGLSAGEAADALGVSLTTAFRDGVYARAWLTAALGGD